MRLQTPPENQGQIVEVSYGWHEGSLYRRVYDHSDRSEAWYVADEEEAGAIPESWHAVNGPPSISRWMPCADPDPDPDALDR